MNSPKNIKNDTYEIEQTDKLQYKQLVLIILLTLIMVLVSLGLSFSIINLLSGEEKSNFNTILVPITPVPGKPEDPGDDKPGKPGENKPGKPPISNKEIVFRYEEKDFIGNGILIENMFPTSDAVGKALVGEHNTFDFVLHFGKNTLNRYYEITAKKQDSSTLDGRYAKIYLESDGQVLNNIMDGNGRVKAYNDYNTASVLSGQPSSVRAKEKLIYSSKVSHTDFKKGYKNFRLKMWLSDETPANELAVPKEFSIKINVYYDRGA